jgi:hypothetical protein
MCPGSMLTVTRALISLTETFAPGLFHLDPGTSSRLYNIRRVEENPIDK